MKYFLIFAFPFFAQAQNSGSVQELLTESLPILNDTLVLLFSIALLVFFWGIAKFILHSGDEDAVEKGKRLMVWGVIALFVLVAIFGIITFLQEMFLGGASPGGFQIRTNPNP